MFFVCFVAFLLPLDTDAQLILPVINSPISFNLNPNNPSPGEKVKVSIESYSVDLDRATIDWFVNGELLARGNGLKTIDTYAGELGSETSISVVVRPDEITEIFDQILIRPMHVSIIWEADTYTSPFYKGRALPSTNATIFLEAYQRAKDTNGNDIPNEDFIFTWKKNGAILKEISGRGRREARIPGPLLFGEDIISVEVVSTDNKYSSKGIARIAAVEPHISLYEDDPLLGIMYHRAIGTEDTIPESDITLAAIPFYTSVRNLFNENVSYVWNVNNQDILTDPRDPFRIILRLASGVVGTAQISLAISHIEHFLQAAEKFWTLSVTRESASQRDPFFRTVN